ncbi:MAG: hypothetical protein CO094_07830 [Anaerolineae bacterium CG_4_9_14_3_um_filter_57_17]|nr:hypothetical protein [bacterium]NCT19686.1 hypothetical protein [bacterium]OIO83482.1 MAG: hypothetical protein AUK01_12540 [Anaerolineae bacterium CG2_30_57_67]PJB66202.1 MAG: hypothetical protein CO094_07830 [Anaerolineae bacterium CG_4_9_14_3_um_filter_57_17]
MRPKTLSETLAEAPRRGRKPAHKRQRRWEADHRPHTFVGVPVEIRADIRNLADFLRREEGMVGGVDAVARELLAYGLNEYALGQLEMVAAPSPGKRALRGAATWVTGPRTIPAPSAAAPGEKKTSSASYRLPQEQVGAIRRIIPTEEEKAAPAVIHLTQGQVFTRLVTCALDAYRAGAFELRTTPLATVQGLSSWSAA